MPCVMRFIVGDGRWPCKRIVKLFTLVPRNCLTTYSANRHQYVGHFNCNRKCVPTSTVFCVGEIITDSVIGRIVGEAVGVAAALNVGELVGLGGTSGHSCAIWPANFNHTAIIRYLLQHEECRTE
jgi:hypothetical protein